MQRYDAHQPRHTRGPRRPRARVRGASVTLAALSMLCLWATPQRAQAWDLGLDVTGQATSLVNADAGAFSDDMATVGTFLRLGTNLGEGSGAGLGFELTWHTFSTSEWVLQRVSTQAEVDVLTLGVHQRWAPLDWLRPYARANLGVGTSALELTQWGSGGASGRTWAPAVAAAGGVELVISPGTLARHGDFTFGVLLEFGWSHVFHVDATLDPTTSVSPGAFAAPIDLGSLGWSGFTTRFGLVVRL